MDLVAQDPTAGRTQVNIISSRKREHSRKPDELYDVIENCSPGPCLEMFARQKRAGWKQLGDEIDGKPRDREAARREKPPRCET